ncbi:unnamed protein product [Caenorhabditis brenneri]
MYSKEYPRLQEKQWLVVDYMDSVVYVEPRRKSGYVFGKVIISYLAYMPRFGYKNVHLFADPSVQNENYIFRIHPVLQVYKKADSSIRYYGSVFAKEKRDGVISRIQKFKDTRKPKKYKSPTDSIPFDGGLWARVMKKFGDGLEEDQKKLNVKLTSKDYDYYFKCSIKGKIGNNAENNFFLELHAEFSEVSKGARF